jgi:hypothetical protein
VKHPVQLCQDLVRVGGVHEGFHGVGAVEGGGGEGQVVVVAFDEGRTGGEPGAVAAFVGFGQVDLEDVDTGHGEPAGAR